MAVMQSDAMKGKLTEEEHTIVHEHIPWTRIVEDTKTEYQNQTVSVLDFLMDNQEKMVMKPIGLFGGKDVAIGKEMSVGEWKAVIQTAVENRFVAQEYIPIPEIDLPVFDQGKLAVVPKKINMNFFAFNGKYAGGMARVSDKSIINISAGGGLIPILLVENN